MPVSKDYFLWMWFGLHLYSLSNSVYVIYVTYNVQMYVLYLHGKLSCGMDALWLHLILVACIFVCHFAIGQHVPAHPAQSGDRL